jgi:hypothetical protein
MKYYCITPATKDKPGVCVLPIMQEPTDFWPGFNETDTDVLNHYEEKKNIWENHLASLPKFPTSCDRVGWFEASEKWHVHTSSYQGESDHYFDTEAEADNKYWEWATWNGNLQAHTDKPRKVIVPVEQKLPDSDDKTLTRFGMGVSESSLKKDWVEQKDEPKDGLTVRKYMLKRFPTDEFMDCPVPKEYWTVIQDYAEAYHASKVEPQPAPKEDSPEAAEVLKKHIGNVSGFHKLTEWHRKFILAAMKEYAESKYTESEVREAFSEGYEAAIHHENFDKAWREFKNELK